MHYFLELLFHPRDRIASPACCCCALRTWRSCLAVGRIESVHMPLFTQGSTSDDVTDRCNVVADIFFYFLGGRSKRPSFLSLSLFLSLFLIFNTLHTRPHFSRPLLHFSRIHSNTFLIPAVVSCHDLFSSLYRAFPCLVS